MTGIKTFTTELRQLINRYSKENGSHTPDFLLAEYLAACLTAYESVITQRDKWFGIDPWAKR